jgi:hypothetical protein
LIVCLVPQPAVDDLNRLENLRCIAAYETWIKIAGILIARESSKRRWIIESTIDGRFTLPDYFTDQDIKSLRFSHQGQIQYGELYKDQWKRKFQNHVKDWSKDGVATFICEDVSELFTGMVREQVRMLNEARRIERDASGNVNVRILYSFPQKKTREEYLSHLATSRAEHKCALADLLELFEDYRGAIRDAAIASHLTDKHLKFLRKKLEGVQHQFAKACKACNYKPKEEHLIYLDSNEWW